MNNYDHIVESFLHDLSSNELNKPEKVVSKQEEEEAINIFLSSLEDYFNKGLTLTFDPVDFSMDHFEERTCYDVEDFLFVVMVNKKKDRIEEEDN